MLTASDQKVILKVFTMRLLPAFLLPGLFYPIAPNNPRELIQQGFLDNQPYVVFRDINTNNVTAHSDICPHAGASLANGWLHQCGGIVCPYHGFVFQNGRFKGIQGTECQGRGGRLVLPPVQTHSDNNIIYISPFRENKTDNPLPYQPPEATNASFVAVSGHRDLNVPQQWVTENILDLQHISWVHLFGNPRMPLARHIKFKRIDRYSGRTTFVYTPRRGTLSSFLAGRAEPDVIVENEYILPTTTVTRVIVDNKYVKTVLTRAQPKTDGTTRLFWTLFRNFYTSPIFDPLVRGMMEYTINEDADILKTIHTQPPNLNLTFRYDVTINNYRSAIGEYLQHK